MICDKYLEPTKSVRSTLGYLVLPVQWASSLPGQLSVWAGDSAMSHASLLEENNRLRLESLVLKQKVQQMISIRTENHQLRELLNTSEQLDDKILVAELIGVDPDPYTHHIIINKGLQHGVFVGQPILDSQGLMGQVIEVLPFTSRVLLVADSNHAIPVQVNRNGLRSIAIGSGLNQLKLPFLPNNADIVPGDLLVTSGLGGTFPQGYPVAIVDNVKVQPNKPFASISAIPKAKLDRIRELLIVWSDSMPVPLIYPMTEPEKETENVEINAIHESR